MEQNTLELYLEYNQQRQADEAREADRLDEAELKALENQVKNRE